MKRLIERRTLIKNSLFVIGSTLIPRQSLSALTPDPANLAGDLGIPSVTLNNGVIMPFLGLGTLTLNNNRAINSVVNALKAGYRHIDTATLYKNEEAVGEGIAQSGIERKDIFLTSKVWVADSGYDEAKAAFQLSLSKLKTDYLDLYLIHRPRGNVKGSWKALEELHIEGKIKAIGISNFLPDQIDELMSYAKVKPAVNQVESHAFFHQNETLKKLKAENIQFVAWSPFAQGKNEMFFNETIAAIAKKHSKTNAQVCLRWHYQRGIISVPRSSQAAHIEENSKIFDFELTPQEMETLATLDLNTTQFPTWK